MKANTKNGMNDAPTLLRFAVNVNHLARWLELYQIARRRWTARLPSIIVASVILAMLIWTVEIGQVDFTLALCLVLLTIALGLQAALSNR